MEEERTHLNILGYLLPSILIRRAIYFSLYNILQSSQTSSLKLLFLQFQDNDVNEGMGEVTMDRDTEIANVVAMAMMAADTIRNATGHEVDEVQNNDSDDSDNDDDEEDNNSDDNEIPPEYIRICEIVGPDGQQIIRGAILRDELIGYQNLATRIRDCYNETHNIEVMGLAYVNILRPWPERKVVYEKFDEVGQHLNPIKTSWNDFFDSLGRIVITFEQNAGLYTKEVLTRLNAEDNQWLQLTYDETLSFKVFYRALHFHFAAMTGQEVDDQYNNDRIWHNHTVTLRDLEFEEMVIPFTWWDIDTAEEDDVDDINIDDFIISLNLVDLESPGDGE